MPEPVTGTILEAGSIAASGSQIYYAVNKLVPMSLSVAASSIYAFENDESTLLYEVSKKEGHPPFGGISQLETNGEHLVWVEVGEPWTLMVMDLKSGKTRKVLTTDDDGQGDLFAITLIDDVVYWLGEYDEDGVIYAYSLDSDELTIHMPQYPLYTAAKIPNSLSELFYLVEEEQGLALVHEKRDGEEILFPLSTDQISALAVSDVYAAWADKTMNPTIEILDFESGMVETIDIDLTAIRSMAFLGDMLLLDATLEDTAIPIYRELHHDAVVLL